MFLDSGLLGGAGSHQNQLSAIRQPYHAMCRRYSLATTSNSTLQTRKTEDRDLYNLRILEPGYESIVI